MSVLPLLPLACCLLFEGGEDSPVVEVEGAATIDWSTAVGVEGPASVAIVLGEFGVGIDTDRALHIPGGRFSVGFQVLARSHPDPLVGDVQVFDNIDGDSHVAVATFAYEHTMLDERLTFRIGRMDANDSFGVHHLVDDRRSVRSRRSFIHSSMGFSPTMLEMPSYPTQALGVVLTGRPLHNVFIDAGLFDATLWRPLEAPRRPTEEPFSRVFAVLDVGVHWALRGRLAGNVGAGAWYLSRPAGDLAAAAAPYGTAGPYFGASQTLFHEHGSPNEGLVAFAQYGWSDRRVSDIAQHFGLGLSWVGLFPARSEDVLGLGASAVEIDRRPRGGTRGAETAIELFYGVRVDSVLQIKPDLQIIVDPGGQRSGETAAVFTMRFRAEV